MGTGGWSRALGCDELGRAEPLVSGWAAMGCGEALSHSWASALGGLKAFFPWKVAAGPCWPGAPVPPCCWGLGRRHAGSHWQGVGIGARSWVWGPRCLRGPHLPGSPHYLSGEGLATQRRRGLCPGHCCAAGFRSSCSERPLWVSGPGSQPQVRRHLSALCPCRSSAGGPAWPVRGPWNPRRPPDRS